MDYHNFISVISVRENLNEQKSLDTKTNFNFDLENHVPLQILDIKQNNQNKKIKILVQFENLKTNEKDTKWIFSLNNWDQNYTIDLVGKYKNNLDQLEEEYPKFADKRKNLLKMYQQQQNESLKKKRKIREQKLSKKKQTQKVKKKQAQKKTKKIQKTKKKNQNKKQMSKKKFEFMHQMILYQIKELQLILKNKKFIEKSKIFHYLNHLSIHTLEIYKKNFNLN